MNELAVLIPCYNEEKRLQIDAFLTYILMNNNIDFYFIDDGSNDDTNKIIKKYLINTSNSNLISFESNLGKGKALRQAIQKINTKGYSYFGFIDADLDIPLEQIRLLWSHLDNTQYLIAVSSRDLRSNFKITRLRSIGSIGMVYIANKILKLEPFLKDTQCGCKLFRSEVLEICFDQPFISEWLFDIEIFLRLKRKYTDSREKIIEVPIERLNVSRKSNFKILQNLKIFKQLYAINAHYR